MIVPNRIGTERLTADGTGITFYGSSLHQRSLRARAGAGATGPPRRARGGSRPRPAAGLADALPLPLDPTPRHLRRPPGGSAMSPASLSPAPLGPAGIWTPHWEVLDAVRCRELAAELEEQGWGSLWYPETLGPRRGVDGLAAPRCHESRRRSAAASPASGRATPLVHPLRTTPSKRRTPDVSSWASVSATPRWWSSSTRSRSRSRTRRWSTYLEEMDAAAYTAPTAETTPRRVLAALGDRMLRLAATKAAGAHPYLVTPEHTAHAREVMGDGPLLIPEMRTYLGPARRRLRARPAATSRSTRCCPTT